jgi:hypothetical protein
MVQSLDEIKDFKGTGIKTPFEKMRARAIIKAGLDAKGLSLINFNLPAFWHYEKRDDAIMILCLWATEPVRLQRAKCSSNPKQAQAALHKRADILKENLQQRRDVPCGFLENALEKMKDAINDEMAPLLQSVA